MRGRLAGDGAALHDGGLQGDARRAARRVREAAGGFALNRRIFWYGLAAVFALVSAFARPAHAHVVGLSQAEYRVAGSALLVTYVFSGTELAASLPALDTNRGGSLSATELAGGQGRLERQLVDATIVRGDGVACQPQLVGASLMPPDAVQIRARFECGAPPQVVAVDCQFIDLFAAGHRHLATVVGTRSDERADAFVLVASRKTFTVDVAHSRGAPEAEGPRTSFVGMVWTGMQHIWTGYNHLAFLLGLVLAGGRVRTLIGTISAFTVAHSITLALAVLHVVTPRASLVEPGIALSIAYVGIENLVVVAPKAWPPLAWRRGREVTGRWRVTFLFGLLHGFGFAAALIELNLPPSRVAPALLGFNVGVELGQLAVLAIVLPAVVFARRQPSFRTSGVGVLSAALTVAGLVWFAARVARA